MRVSPRTFLAPLALAATLTAAAPASAVEPAETWGRGQVYGGPRVGTNHLNFGLGVHGGYTLDMGLYLGGSFDYFFGYSDNYYVGPGVRYGDVSYNLWQLSFEAGYDFRIIDRMMIRPYGGLGVLGASFSYHCNAVGPYICGDHSDTTAVFTLGGLMDYFLTEQLFIGPDLRLLFHSDVALVVGGHFGVAF